MIDEYNWKPAGNNATEIWMPEVAAPTLEEIEYA
jgi:hypothetical protein